MSQLITAEMLFEMAHDDKRYELVQGELRMMSPAGGMHGKIAMRLANLLSNYVDEQNLGIVYAAETGFKIALEPDTVRAPDVAFVTAEKAATIEDEQRFVPFAPDLAIEVISPYDSFAEVQEKAICWLDAGCGLVLLADAKNRTIHVCRPNQAIQRLTMNDTFSTETVVPGWSFRLADVFKK